MNNEIDYSVRKGIRPTPKCEDYELCACDADGASHTLKVSFNESDQIVDAVIERVNNNVQLEWRGPEDGLPPVGTVCEISNCGNPFTWCHVKYMGERLCVVDHRTHIDQHYHLSSVEFRPIRSKEDKVIEEMLEVCKQGSASYPTSEEMVRRLYRDGWRKQENPE